jgi:hypothetical protein
MSNNGEPAVHECKLCGAKSPWQQGFLDRRRPFFGQWYKVCVTCHAYALQFRWFYWRWAFAALTAIFLGTWITGGITTGLLVVLGLYVALYLAVVLHELGHAGTAIALGMRVVAMSLGGGLRTRVFSWRNIFVLLGPSPVEGLVVLSPDTTRHYRKKMALVLFAGPATNVLCALVGVAAFGDAPRTLGSGFVGLWTAANVIMIFNLWPMSTRGAFGQLSSDGLQLLKLIKVSPAEVDKFVRDARLVEAHLAFAFDALDRAHAAIAPNIASNDLDGKGRVLATAVLVTKGDVAGGIELARRYLRADDNSDLERAVLMNNLAWALIDAPEGELTPARLAEADELSGAAMALLPMMTAVRGTRGAVLVERGKYREAAGLLGDRRFKLESRKRRAAVKATLALALAGLGELESAHRTLREAFALDAGNTRAQRVRARLDRAPPSSSQAAFAP